MTSTDDHGFVKYWQANLNNVHTFQAHNDPVRSSRWDSSVSVEFLCYIKNNTDELCQISQEMFAIMTRKGMANNLCAMLKRVIQN